MRRLVVLLLILALIGSSVAPFLSVKADPYLFQTAPAPANSNPIIKITSPKENATYTNGTINVCFTVTGSNNPIFYAMSLLGSYKGDWMKDFQRAYGQVGEDFGEHYEIPIFLQYNFNVTGIPFGEHSLLIKAYGTAYFHNNNHTIPSYGCSLATTLCVNFSVRTNPIITFPSLQNATFETSSLPLNFTVDHPVSEMVYCIDGQETVPISGNTTLTGLSNGQHNVTVYATDEFGNTDASNILFFNVNAPESSVPVVAAFVVIVVCAGVTFLVFFKKQKKI